MSSAKARESDRATYEGLLSRADKEKRELMQNIEEMRKSLQDLSAAQADGMWQQLDLLCIFIVRPEDIILQGLVMQEQAL